MVGKLTLNRWEGWSAFRMTSLRSSLMLFCIQESGPHSISCKQTVPCWSAQISSAAKEGRIAWCNECCSCIMQAWCLAFGRVGVMDSLRDHTWWYYSTSAHQGTFTKVIVLLCCRRMRRQIMWTTWTLSAHPCCDERECNADMSNMKSNGSQKRFEGLP